MTKFSGPEDLYKELVEDSDDSWLFGLVAFAVIEEQKIEWMRHQERENGSLPEFEEVRTWYEQQPQAALLRAKGTAESALTVFLQEAFESEYGEKQQEIEEGIIVSEIRELKQFWPQFGVNLAGGFASALLFAVLLSIFAFFVVFDTSPVEIGTELRDTIQEQNNGQERSN